MDWSSWAKYGRPYCAWFAPQITVLIASLDAAACAPLKLYRPRSSLACNFNHHHILVTRKWYGTDHSDWERSQKLRQLTEHMWIELACSHGFLSSSLVAWCMQVIINLCAIVTDSKSARWRERKEERIWNKYSVPSTLWIPYTKNNGPLFSKLETWSPKFCWKNYFKIKTNRSTFNVHQELSKYGVNASVCGGEPSKLKPRKFPEGGHPKIYRF